MPPIPPPPGIPPPWPFFCGTSATIASVVIKRPATDAAPWIAERTTLVGSMTPLLTRLPYSPACASKPQLYWSFSRILPTMTEPSSPALVAIWRAGVWIALRTMSTPCFWSSLATFTRLRASVARNSATPPPGRMPSSTAARVACIASSTRSLRSFTSISVAPPTRITATPPASFADRKSTRLNSSHTVIYTLSLHDALPICAGGMHRVIDAILALLHLDFGGAADADHRNAAGELRRSEEHTSELQSHSDLHSFPTRRSSDLRGWHASRHRRDPCAPSPRFRWRRRRGSPQRRRRASPDVPAASPCRSPRLFPRSEP